MIESYKQTRVYITPSGELILALPVYSDQSGALFNEDEMKGLTGMSFSVGMYEKIGYIVYHDSQDFSFYMKSLDLFIDLGEL